MTVELFLSDCRELNPPEGKYCVITDPVWPNSPKGMFPVDDPHVLLTETLEIFREAIRVVVVMRLDSDPRFLNAVRSRWPFFRTCCLPYTIPGYIGRKLGGHEYAYSFGPPIRSGPGARVIPGIAPVAPVSKDRRHPCPRSIHHMRWLVNWFSESDEIIVDPFMGSGTIGVATVERGRRFLGCEINEDYFRLAEENIYTATAQQRLALNEEVTT